MMNQEMMVKLRRSLVQHEGYEKFPYEDTKGKITIGIGYNLTDRGIDDDWINRQYLDDVTYFYNQLCTFPWFQELNQDRQIALVDMCFMGWKRFLEFQRMLTALALGEFDVAAAEIMNSEWAREVKGRASRIAEVILTGVYQI